MNYYGSYSNKDDVASATWPDHWAMGDYLYPNISVPQSTYPDPVLGGYPSTAGSYIPNFNAADDAAFSLAPTTEMEEFANLPIQADFRDFTNQVSIRCVRTSTWTYPAVPQNVDPWTMPGPCVFLSCICHYSLYSLDADPKPTSMRIPRSPKPAARTPKQNISGKPKEAGRGAERLATTSPQGIYHQSLPWPSFQQGWSMDAAADLGRGESVHHIDSTVQQEATKLLLSPAVQAEAYVAPPGLRGRLRAWGGPGDQVPTLLRHRAQGH